LNLRVLIDEQGGEQATLNAPGRALGLEARALAAYFIANHSNKLPGGGMATKLEKTLKREIDIDGKAYMVAISPEGVKVTQKGFRRGPELSWRSIISGEAETGQQLRGSLSATGGDSEE
jgi:hypothetical protein